MLGIFGGSFDPVHFGHIKTALALLRHYQFDEIRFIPCKQSPLKDRTIVDARYRWEMLNLITHSIDKFSADDIELKRDSPSYTIDTLKELYNRLKNKQIMVLIIGLDAFLEFCSWKDYGDILLYCHVMLLQRPRFKLPNMGCEYEFYMDHKADDISILMDNACGYIYLSNVEKIDVSSTNIRDIISAGNRPKYMLPGNIWNYIRRNNLYQIDAK